MIFVVGMTQLGCLSNLQTVLCLYVGHRELIPETGKEHNKIHRSLSNPQSQVKSNCFGVIILREHAAMQTAGVVQELWGGHRHACEACGKAQLRFSCLATGIAFHPG